MRGRLHLKMKKKKEKKSRKKPVLFPSVHSGNDAITRGARTPSGPEFCSNYRQGGAETAELFQSLLEHRVPTSSSPCRREQGCRWELLGSG